MLISEYQFTVRDRKEDFPSALLVGSGKILDTELMSGHCNSCDLMETFNTSDPKEYDTLLTTVYLTTKGLHQVWNLLVQLIYLSIRLRYIV